jgi:hypothetical protein
VRAGGRRRVLGREAGVVAKAACLEDRHVARPEPEHAEERRKGLVIKEEEVTLTAAGDAEDAGEDEEERDVDRREREHGSAAAARRRGGRVRVRGLHARGRRGKGGGGGAGAPLVRRARADVAGGELDVGRLGGGRHHAPGAVSGALCAPGGGGPDLKGG